MIDRGLDVGIPSQIRFPALVHSLYNGWQAEEGADVNSRSRVLAAFNHMETDRVPIDFSGHRSSGISAIAYPRLRDYLGLESRPVRVYDIQQQLAVVDNDVLERFEVDTIELGRAFALDDADWADWTLPDGLPCQVPVWTLPERVDNGWVIRSQTGRIIAQMPRGALYFESAYFPWAENEADHDRLPEAMAECMWNIPSPPGPLVDGPQGDRLLVAGARRLRANSDGAILGVFGGNLMEWGQYLYRNDNFLALLAADPNRAHDLLERLTQLHLTGLEKYLGLVGPYIDIIVFGDDLGMQTGPQISPRMYREFFKLRHGRLWQRAKELADVRVMLHSCGDIRLLLPDLIEAGLDAVNPVQISCKGMEAEGLKRDFGKDITFWGGGCDTQWLLSHGTPEAIREHVKLQVEIMRQGGGFVFQQVHNILADVPPQNIVAMFDTARSLVHVT
jgi:uroporphyrinogen decarboxylase